MAPSATEVDDRAALTSRVLPQMTLSTGDEASLTGPPAPMPHYLNPEGRSRLRFSVEGNAIITGGAGTLGLSAANALLEHGLSGIMILDLSATALVSAVSALQTSFPSAKILSRIVDITDEVSVSAAIDEATVLLGSIDTLFCFAGVVSCQHAIDMSPSSFRRTLDINTTGSFLCAQACAKQMIAQNTGGSIVFTASISGHRVNFPQPQVAYNVSKAALISLKSSLAAEWARYGIRVNSISPGYMDTILNEGEGLGEGRRIWNERSPMGRMGVPEELTGTVVLLASNAGSYINGADIVVDGGQIVF